MKKNQTDILELKNSVNEKSAIESICIREDQIEDRITWRIGIYK